MTVKELIAELQKIENQDMPVTVSYDGDEYDLREVKVEKEVHVDYGENFKIYPEAVVL